MIVVVSVTFLFMVVVSVSAELKCGVRNYFPVGIFKSSSLRTCASSRAPIVVLDSVKFAFDNPISVNIGLGSTARLVL